MSKKRGKRDALTGERIHHFILYLLFGRAYSVVSFVILPSFDTLLSFVYVSSRLFKKLSPNPLSHGVNRSSLTERRLAFD